jgi:hypothetical protein
MGVLSMSDFINEQPLPSKKTNPKADIDRLVYELYGLTEEEIKILEEGVK